MDLTGCVVRCGALDMRSRILTLIGCFPSPARTGAPGKPVCHMTGSCLFGYWDPDIVPGLAFNFALEGFFSLDQADGISILPVHEPDPA